MLSQHASTVNLRPLAVSKILYVFKTLKKKILFSEIKNKLQEIPYHGVTLLTFSGFLHETL